MKIKFLLKISHLKKVIEDACFLRESTIGKYFLRVINKFGFD